MGKLRQLSPRITVIEAKKILARAVLKAEGEKNHDEYKQSLNSIRKSAMQFLQSEKAPIEKPKKKIPEEIVVQPQEKPGPCPCLNCKNMTHIPGLAIYHSCLYCTKQFQKTSHLRSHLLFHSSKREHKCAVCGKMFKRHDLMVRHLYTHDKDLVKHRYRCKHCNATFTRKDNFKTHIKRKTACRESLGQDNDIYSGLEDLLQDSDLKSAVKIIKPKRKEPENCDPPQPTDEEYITESASPQQNILIPVTNNPDGTVTVAAEDAPKLIENGYSVVEGRISQDTPPQTGYTVIQQTAGEQDQLVDPVGNQMIEIERGYSVIDERSSMIPAGKETDPPFSPTDQAPTPPDIMDLVTGKTVHLVQPSDHQITGNSCPHEEDTTMQPQIQVVQVLDTSMPITQQVILGPEQEKNNLSNNQPETTHTVVQLGAGSSQLLVLMSQLSEEGTQLSEEDTQLSGEQQQDAASQPTDILSQVIEGLLEDTSDTTEQEADDQIINIMQGEHTITSTPPPPKKQETELLPEITEETLLSYISPSKAAHEGETVNEIVEPPEKARVKRRRKNTQTPKKKKSPGKLPLTSPIEKVLKITNSRRPPKSSLVKQIFRAKKRLFAEKDNNEEEVPSKIIKLGTWASSVKDALEKNDRLRAAAMENKPLEPPKNIKEEPSVEEDSPIGGPSVRLYSPISMSPDLLQEGFKSLYDTMLSPISPLLRMSPPLLPSSPNFLIISSPGGSKTPDRVLFHRSGTPDSKSPGLLLGSFSSPDRTRHSTPEPSILQTPDRYKISGMPTFEDNSFGENYIFDLEQMFKSKLSSPDNNWFRSFDQDKSAKNDGI